MYGDSEQMWDGVHWDRHRAGFFALRETDEKRAGQTTGSGIGYEWLPRLRSALACADAI
jgi:hypothetical protein